MTNATCDEIPNEYPFPVNMSHVADELSVSFPIVPYDADKSPVLENTFFEDCVKLYREKKIAPEESVMSHYTDKELEEFYRQYSHIAYETLVQNDYSDVSMAVSRKHKSTSCVGETPAVVYTRTYVDLFQRGLSQHTQYE
jgi:hypothetical protein